LRKVVLDLVINRGCKSSSSYALYGFVRKHRDLITKEQALSYIRQLLSAENGHHAYLRLIVDEALSLKHHERLDLLLSVAPSVPTNPWLWKTVWLWIERHYQSKEQRGEILQQLYQSGCQDSEILNRLLQCRPPQEARNYAKEWLAERTTHPHVLCRCLELLGEEAKDQARQLLDNPTTHPHVQCRCLELLGEEAKDQARQLLGDPTTSFEVLCRCLELLGEEAKERAKQLLDDPTTSSDVLCRCLELLGEEAKDQARQLLDDPTTSSHVLCRCLELLGEEAKERAKLLLDDPTTSSNVLCRCLELLGEEAKDQAKLLLVDSKDKEVLCRCLELLGEEAKPFATERIRNWTETEAILLVRCFQIAGETPKAQKAADEMLTAWDKRVPTWLRVAALRAPFDTLLRTQRAREVLDDWHRQYRPLVAAALMAFWNNPDAVTRDCRAIISRWHPEIVYRRTNQKRSILRDYDGHIIKALFHPALRKEASQAAQAMLYKENDSPGFLSPELHRQAENIIRGEWEPWAVPGKGITQEPSEQAIISEPLPVVAQQERPPKPSSRQKAPKQTKKRTSSTPQEPTLEPWKQSLAKLQSLYQNEDTE
jgi:hypothetical protein